MQATLAMPAASELVPLIPEMTLAGLGFLLLMLDLFLSDARRGITHVLSVLALLVVAAMLVMGVGAGSEPSVLGGMFVRDTMADVLKICTCGVSAIALLFLWPDLRERGLYRGEVSVLVLFAVLGMMLLISAGSLVMVYLGLELLALSSYALVAIDRDSPLASEAAIKYFVLGALASGLLLYGMSLVYGATGSLDLATIRNVAAGVDHPMLLLAGVVFMTAGVSFKFGAAPFHMWLPDVYHGAPTPITLFISSAPKLAAFAMVVRLFGFGTAPLAEQWQPLMAVLATLSLVVGNVIALVQANLKRMLAYSTISHVGFVFLGFAGGGAVGYASAMFYAISYALMATAAFGAIVLMARRGFEADRIADYKGLNARDPWSAAMVLCVMASLAGVPPFLGFWAKLAVLRAAIDGGMLWLAIVGIVFAVIGAYYYLHVMKVMYFDAPEEGHAPMEARENGVMRFTFAVNALALLVLGVFWNPIMAWCQAAFV